MNLPKHSASYWPSPPSLIFWHSGTLVLNSQRQSAQMSENIKSRLEQYDAEHFKVWPFDTTGFERIK